jgi:hypothetical protein
LGDATERIGPETHRTSIGIHRSVEIAGVLQIESQIDMDFGNVRLRLDATAIRLDRAWRVAQVFADQSKREPKRGRRSAEELRLVQARRGPIAVRPSDASTFQSPLWLRQSRAPQQAPIRACAKSPAARATRAAMISVGE